MTILKLENIWGWEGSYGPIIVRVDEDQYVTIQKECKHRELIFTLEEWQELVTFVAKEIAKQGVDDATSNSGGESAGEST